MSNIKHIVDTYFTISQGVEGYQPNEVGFTYIKKGQRVSVFTEEGCSRTSLFYIPIIQNKQPYGLSNAETHLYAIVYPEDNLIALGRPKKLRFWIKSSRSQWTKVSDGDMEYIAVKKNVLKDMFDFIYEI